MPDIQDTRSKDELLSRIKLDKRIKELGRKKPTNWIAAFVAAAAILVLSLLLPSMLGGEDKASNPSLLTDHNESSFTSEKSVILESAESQEESADSDVELFSQSSQDAATNYSEAVYFEDTVNATLFHLGLVSNAATSVPVTFVIPNSQIKEDFGEHAPTSLELYEKYSSQLDEVALGFSEYHPYKGKLSAEGEKLIHTLPNGHGYDMASGTMEVYKGTLQDTFYGFKEIEFQSEDGTTVEFDQVGEPSKPLQLASGINHYNYYLFIQEDGHEFLSSNFMKTSESLEEALQEMKIKPNDIYSTVIPENISFNLTDSGDFMKVQFTEPLDLDSMDPNKALQMIEGMLLTAGSFEEQLKFENVVQPEWNRFDFSKPLPIPVGPNSIPFIVK